MPAKKTYLHCRKGFTPLDSSKSKVNTIKNKAKFSIGANVKSRRYLTGLTLIEVMLSILLLTVVVIGTSGYRYYSALDARRAIKHETAARIASLLNEGWRGIVVLGNDPYDPTILNGLIPDFVISTFGNGLAVPTGFTLFNNTNYKVVSGNATYYVTMSYQIADIDSNDNLHDRMILNIQVAWPITAQEVSYTAEDYRVFALTTYAERGRP